MSHLAVQVQDYLSQPGVTATAIEAKAGLKRGTLDSIQRGQHPRPERLGQLIRALDENTARRWLVAYFRDDCPTEFLPRLEIRIDEVKPDTNASIGAINDSRTPTDVLAAWHRLATAMQSDVTLARWFVKTVELALDSK